MEYKYPLTATNRGGSTLLLYTIEDVRAFVSKYGWWGEEWQRNWWYAYGERNPHPSTPWFYSRRNELTHYEWIIRDDFGAKVKPTNFDFSNNNWREKHIATIRHAESLGLPIPGQRHSRAGWKQNAPAKKNSGAGKRNRDRSICREHQQEYNIQNRYGSVQRWEGY